HLYLGQECQTPTRVYNDEIPGKPYKLKGRIMDIDLVIDQVGVHLPGNAPTDLNNYAFSEIKLILRPLSDMTEEEMKCIEITDKEFLIANLESGNEPTLTADHLRYLLSKGFDLFGLIDDGLAINKLD